MTRETRDQGLVVVETAEISGYMLMLPDGQVRRVEEADDVVRVAKTWARADLRKAELYAGHPMNGLLKVEWRGEAALNLAETIKTEGGR